MGTLQVNSSSANQGFIEEKRRLMAEMEAISQSKDWAASTADARITALRSELETRNEEKAEREVALNSWKERCQDLSTQLARMIAEANNAGATMMQQQVTHADVRKQLMAAHDTSTVMFLSGFAISSCKPVQEGMDWFLGLFADGIDAHMSGRRPLIIKRLKRLLALSKPYSTSHAYDAGAPLLVKGMLNPCAIPNNLGKESLTKLVTESGLDIVSINSYVHSVVLVIFRLDSISTGIAQLTQLIVGDGYIDWFRDQQIVEDNEADVYMWFGVTGPAREPCSIESCAAVVGLSQCAAAPEPLSTELGDAVIDPASALEAQDLLTVSTFTPFRFEAAVLAQAFFSTMVALPAEEPITVEVIGPAQPASVAGHSEVAAIEAGLAGLTVGGGAA